jgi:uncharacterized Zn-finger protein
MHKRVKPSEIIVTHEERVGCDGGDKMGHPLVYLAVPHHGEVQCPYCSRLFVWGAEGGADSPHAA